MTEYSSAVLFGVLADWWQRVYESPASGVFKLIMTEARNFPDISAFYLSEVIEPCQVSPPSSRIESGRAARIALTTVATRSMPPIRP